MMVVPDGALTNITAALLTVEPTDLVLDADAFAKAQARQRRAASRRRRSCGSQHSGIGDHHEAVDLVGFDPARDFTIQPWLAEKLNRPLQADDVILGASRDAPLGSQAADLRQAAYRLRPAGRTGVGTHERGVFMSFATLRGAGDTACQTATGPPRGARQGYRLPGRAGARRDGAAGALCHPVEPSRASRS